MALKDYFANIPKRQLILLIVAGCGAVGAGYWYFLLKPAFDEKAKLEQELQGLKTELHQKRLIASNKVKLEQEIQVLEERLSQAVARLPEEKEIPALLTQVNALGRQSGLDFLLFKPGKSIKRDFYIEIPIQLRVEGTYHALGLFFDKVSKMPRIVNISDLSIAPVRDRKKAGHAVVAEFNATTYTFAGGKR